jgi:hypothetical protein
MPKTNSVQQVEAMIKEVAASVTIKCTVECYFCGSIGVWDSHDFCDYATERNAAEDAAVSLYDRGWRIITSQKYQVTGAMRCPECKEEA